MSAPEIMVRMGEMATAGALGSSLVSIGLGSCIGLALLDRGKRIAGLAHVMLPAAPPAGPGDTPAKFADHAVPALLDELTRAGARKERLEAVLVGGARMFAIGSSLDIGARNEAATRDALKAHRIPVRATATSGNTGRTIRVSPGDGVVTVKEAGAATEVLYGGKS